MADGMHRGRRAWKPSIRVAGCREIVLNAFERMSRTLPAVILIAAQLCAGARADDAVTRMFSVGGFGTLGAVHSSERSADFTGSAFKPNGAGHSRSWSAGVDSLIGAQLTANFTPRLSAVVQLIAEQRYTNSYWPHVEWANLRYQFTPDFSLRIGRVVLPSFLVADYRKVGYANPWVRPPLEVYSLIPVSSIDGADASYRMRLGEATNILQADYGGSESKIPGHGAVRAKQVCGFTDTVEYGAVTARVSYQQGKVTIDSFDPLFAAYRQFGPGGVALADRYEPHGKLLQFFGAGASYDPGDWFVMGEWGIASRHSVIRRQTGWYATGGYRYKKITPYFTLGQLQADDHSSDPGLAAPGAARLNATFNQILRSTPVQNTLSVGGRWDFARNVDLKMQYDHVRIGAASPGTLVNLQPGFQPGGHVNLFSIAVDFVF